MSSRDGRWTRAERPPSLVSRPRATSCEIALRTGVRLIPSRLAMSISRTGLPAGNCPVKISSATAATALVTDVFGRSCMQYSIHLDSGPASSRDYSLSLRDQYLGGVSLRWLSIRLSRIPLTATILGCNSAYHRKQDDPRT